MRVFLGLTEVSGYFSGLREGLENLGVECVHVSLQPHKFGYAGGQSSSLFPLFACAAVRWRLHASERGPLVRGSLLLLTLLSRLLLFIWAVGRFDVFVLGAGSSFFRFMEFPLFRLLGKRVVYTLHGTDARPPYIDGFFEPEHYDLRQDQKDKVEGGTSINRSIRMVEAHIRIAALRKRQIRQIERYADAIVCGPSFSHFLTRPFVSFYSIGIPLVVPKQTRREDRLHDKVQILHAPSYARGKGTDQVRATMAELAAQGCSIDYREITGRPNAEVLAEIGNSDLVVDQVYSDTPMAMFAAEAASLGKPAVVGGYYSQVMRSHLPPEQIPPTAFCRPEQLEETIAMLIKDDERRQKLGDEAMRFVLERWSAQAVASRFLRLFEGVPPSEWLIDPSRVIYLHGCGLSEKQAKANVAAVIRTAGVGALQLSHKPELEKLFLEFAGTELANDQSSTP